MDTDVMETIPVENLYDDAIWLILDKCDYPTLKSLAKTNKRFLTLVTQKFSHEAKVGELLLGPQKNKRLFIEKLYHLNSYRSADPRGITISKSGWTKGTNKIVHGPGVHDAYWYLGTDLHRYDGPARTECEGKIIYKWWYNHGKVHRTDGPALEHWASCAGGKWYIQRWYIQDQFHRDDGPAIITQYLDKDQYDETWYRNGNPHRDDGPAALSFFKGKITMEIWYKDGKLHRVGGPAYFMEFENESEKWYFEGVEHRVNSPGFHKIPPDQYNNWQKVEQKRWTQPLRDPNFTVMMRINQCPG